MCDPEFYSSRTPKAAKKHKCCECQGEIKIGENYQRVSGVWDGEFAEYKTCFGCSGIRDKAGNYEWREIRERGPYFTELREWFYNGVSKDWTISDVLSWGVISLDMNQQDLEKLLKI